MSSARMPSAPISATNAGATRLRRKRSQSDPMRLYDGLPPALRGWLAGAALPWSPSSCRRIWFKALKEGADEAEALARLARAEARALAKDSAFPPL